VQSKFPRRGAWRTWGRGAVVRTYRTQADRADETISDRLACWCASVHVRPASQRKD
jgi:hypothetical protein